MKNVTITLPEQTLAKLRIEAARAGKSVSKFMADLAEDRIGSREADPGEDLRVHRVPAQACAAAAVTVPRSARGP